MRESKSNCFGDLKFRPLIAKSPILDDLCNSVLMVNLSD